MTRVNIARVPAASGGVLVNKFTIAAFTTDQGLTMRHAPLVIFAVTLIGCAAPSAVKMDSSQGARGPIDKMLLIVRDEAGGSGGGEDPLKALTRKVKEDLVRAGYAVSDPWETLAFRNGRSAN